MRIRSLCTMTAVALLAPTAWAQGGTADGPWADAPPIKVLIDPGPEPVRVELYGPRRRDPIPAVRCVGPCTVVVTQGKYLFRVGNTVDAHGGRRRQRLDEPAYVRIQSRPRWQRTLGLALTMAAPAVVGVGSIAAIEAADADRDLAAGLSLGVIGGGVAMAILGPALLLGKPDVTVYPASDDELGPLSRPDARVRYRPEDRTTVLDTRVDETPNLRWLFAGAIIFGMAYGVSATFGVANASFAPSDRWLVVPVFGPSIAAGHSGAPVGGFVSATVFQVLGLGAVGLGYAYPTRSVEPASHAGIAVAPFATRTGGGITFGGAL